MDVIIIFYNRGNNGENIFIENDNYIHFPRLYEKYIEPVTETFAWCLLKNHFHFLIYVKTEEEINPNKLSYTTVKQPKKITATNQFSHFFNAYTQAIKKKHKRSGSLFERNLIFYIHNNPVQHGFTDDINDYPWSSYNSIISTKPTHIQRKKVVEIFDDLDNYKYYHSINHKLNDLSDLLID